MLDADIYEEEDCAPNALGLYLADNLSYDDARFLLDKVPWIYMYVCVCIYMYVYYYLLYYICVYVCVCLYFIINVRVLSVLMYNILQLRVCVGDPPSSPNAN